MCIHFLAINSSVSEKAILSKSLDKILRALYLDGKEESADFKEILDLKYGLDSCRFLSPKEIIPKNRAMNEMLWQYPHKEFRQIVSDKLGSVNIKPEYIFSTSWAL